MVAIIPVCAFVLNYREKYRGELNPIIELPTMLMTSWLLQPG